MRKTRNTHDTPGARDDEAPAASPGRWWLVAALVVATMALAYPVLGGAFLVNPHSDQFIAGYGFREFAAQSLRHGAGFPGWSPYLFGGLPYIAAMHGDIFYPTFLLRMLMRTDLAMSWGFIIHIFLAGAFTLGFLRALGLSRWPALFGGLTYMLSGPIASYVSPGHDGKLFVSALLPLALWMLVRAIGDERGWAWGVFALTVGLAVLSPHPQLLQYFLLVSGAFALFLVWHAARRPTLPAASIRTTGPGSGPTSAPTTETIPTQHHDVRFAVTRLGAALGMVVLGLCIGAIQYWPVLGYVNSSPRAGGREYDFAAQYSLPPEELLNTYVPQFTGILDSYWGRNLIHLHSEYLGIVVLMLVPLAFGAGSRRAMARFWAATAVVSLLWALGGFTPFFHLVYLLPGTRYFRAPSTIIYVLMFALTVLASLGFERVLARHVSARWALRYGLLWCAFGAVVAVFGYAGVLTAWANTLARGVAVAHGYDPAGYGEFVDRNQSALALGTLRSLVVVLVTTGLLVAFTQRRLKATAFAMLLVVASTVDLWSIARRYWLWSPPASSLFASDPLIEYLKHQSEPGRVFVYTKTSDYRTPADPYFGVNGFGMSTGFMVHGIRSVTGYQGNVLARYERLSAGNGLISPTFWRHENVRWLYTNAEITDTALKKIAGPVENAAHSTSYLYTMPGENPYAWVASTAASIPDTVVERTMLAGTYDPRSLTAFGPESGIGGSPPSPLPAPSPIRTSVTHFGAGYATVQLSAAASAGNALVVSENYYPGWSALVDGKPVAVGRADYNLVGVPLPAGARTVVLTFRDPRYATGRTITLIALVVTGLLIALGARLHRGARPGKDRAPFDAGDRRTAGGAA